MASLCNTTARVQLAALLLVSALLLVLWSFAVPIFETPDEPAHWQYAVYLRNYGRLPLYSTLFQEANQPPIYYLLVAPFAGNSELPQGRRIVDAQGVVRRPSGLRWFEESASDLSKYWPLRIVRLVTALISLLTIFCCYEIGFVASESHRTGLLAGSLVAFLPQFTFIGMHISNDALVTCLAALATLCLVLLIRRGFTWRFSVVSAVVAALAILSKVNAVFLPVPFSLAILSERVPWRTRVGRLGVLIISFVLVLPWLVYNQITYGDPLASGVMASAVNNLVAPKALTSPYFIGEFPSWLFRSFIGVFGWMNVLVPDDVYAIFGLLAALSLLGGVRRFFSRRQDSRMILILSTIPLVSLAMTIFLNLTFTQPQGRYLFPALPAVAALVAMGLEGLPRWSHTATLCTVVMIALLHVWVLLNVIVPLYWISYG